LLVSLHPSLVFHDQGTERVRLLVLQHTIDFYVSRVTF
jgi:hypothetical protein